MLPKLTIGTACAGDFDGPCFTIQSLRLHHADAIRDCEIIVVDNSPESRIGDRLRRFCSGLPGVRYIPFPAPKGTAAPRGHIFEQAKAPAVLCLDSHVLLPPGAIARLIHWFELHPDTRDLVTGPIVWDDMHAATGDGQGLATHFNPAWGAGMYGQWATDPRGLDPAGPPFEIEMMGLGLFACRRDAFPGFNARMRGFGGEEGYLHEKVRRSGGRNLCLPWLRWWHRFNEFVPNAAPYEATNEDKAWNYCVGWGELGWNLAAVREHFLTIIPAERFDAIAAAAARGDDLPPHRAARGAVPTSTTTTTDCGCTGQPPVADPAATDFADVHAETLAPYVSQLSPESVVYAHAATGSAAVATLVKLHAGSVLAFSPRHTGEAFAAFREHGRDRFALLTGQPQPPMKEADLLVLTGYRDGRELLPHAEVALTQSRRFVAVHGTNRPDTREAPGLLTGLRFLLRERPEWSVIHKSTDGDGLLVLSKLAEDKPRLPPLTEQGKNFLGATLRSLRAGLKGDQVAAPTPLAEARLMVCTTCDFRVEDRCSSCGCFLAAKAGLLHEDCPEVLWPSPKLYQLAGSKEATT